MIRVTTFDRQRVAVFGLARSGLATAHALKAGGAIVIAWDDNASAQETARAQGFDVSDLKTEDWSTIKALVISPGVPLTHPQPHWTVDLAKAADVPVIGDVELFFRERAKVAPGSPVVAITGTNGKSTTTALTAHLFEANDVDVAMGGNIGVGVLSLPPPAQNRVHVLELSSYQIDLTPSLAPTIGVLLNISPDHLDRHGTMENYAAVKERLVLSADRAIIGIDDDWCREIADKLRMMERSWVDLVSVVERVPNGWYLAEDRYLNSRAPWAAVFGAFADMSECPTLRGAHNAQNALAASCAAMIFGLSKDQVRKALSSFSGLMHRMENVGREGKVLYVNDSKATNADSTEKALAAYPADIFWILGGEAKAGGIDPLVHLFPRVKKAFLIGRASDDFAKTLDGKVPYARCNALDVAVAEAAAAARERATNADCSEAIVLLSPACASFDQYKSFEHRGDHFRLLALAIDGIVPAGQSA
jgi:UDP-N-acetylmuramoylalanine--D-glutamate ligase